MIIWIIGLSGAGKSTLANEIIKNLKLKNVGVVNLDGDLVRHAFENDLGHSIEDRRKNSKRISRFGKLISDQGFIVITPILSIFPEDRQWLRENAKNYYEVYIESPIETLIKRDSKNIYSNKHVNNNKVAGVDIEFPIPRNADLIIDNSGDLKDLIKFGEKIADMILERIVV